MSMIKKFGLNYVRLDQLDIDIECFINYVTDSLKICLSYKTWKFDTQLKEKKIQC